AKMRFPIQQDFWQDLRREKLIPDTAPTPSTTAATPVHYEKRQVMQNVKAFAAAKPAADYRLFAPLRERIARIPRLSIAVRPTPMMEAPNLARHLGGPRIFVKRDDLTGVAFGG